MTEVIEKMNGVKLPSGVVISVSSKNDSERIRNAWKLYGELTDGVAKKLAAYVVRCKGMVLKEVVESFKELFSSETEMVLRRDVKTILGFPAWC